eukprot:s9647_g1.t1
MGAFILFVIFTCSFGDGHKSAQQAVEDFLQAAGFVVEAVDTTHDPRFEESGSIMDSCLLSDTSLENFYARCWCLEDSLQRRLSTRLMDVWYNRMVLRWKMYSIQNMVESMGTLFFGQWNSPCPSPTCNTPTKEP